MQSKSSERLAEAEAVYAELKRVLTHVKALLSGVEEVMQQNRPEGERRKHRIHKGASISSSAPTGG